MNKKKQDQKFLYVVFMPDWSEGNPYQNLLKNHLSDENIKVVYKNFPKGFFSLNKTINNLPSAKVIHIHWINDFIEHVFWSKNFFYVQTKIFLLGFDIILAKARGRKVVWTIHNLVSHETPNEKVEIKLRKIIARTCSKIIIHSNSALKVVEKKYNIKIAKKTSIIPHGNYDNCYSLNQEALNKIKKHFLSSDACINLLFFGAIRKYKGIEKLISAFNKADKKNVRLILAGRPQDEQTKNHITKLSECNNRITLFLEFIPEEYVSALFNLADAIVIPFEKTLTSGSLLLAMTMGKAILLSDKGKIFDIVDKNGVFFFESESSLCNIISSLDIIGRQRLVDMGKKNRFLADQLNWSTISKMTALVYKS